MIEPASSFRLEGFEPDNLLAFLALLGLLRALEEAERGLRDEERWWPRASWDIESPPLRPRLHLARPVERAELLARVEAGLAAFRSALDFEGRKMPDFAPDEFRTLAAEALERTDRRLRLDALAALATDQVLDEGSTAATPLCLMTGQGHQFFLQRVATVPFASAADEPGKSQARDNRPGDLERAFFGAWERTDTGSNLSFRWDPEEAARQALMAGDPTDNAFKLGTEKGANRLAAIGLTVLPVAAGAEDRAVVPGFRVQDDGPALLWPIWREPASLAAVRAMLAQSGIAEPGGLARLGVETVMRAPIEAIGKFKNVGRARPLLVDKRA